MSKYSLVLIPCLAAWLTGCDSQSQLTANRIGAQAFTVPATQSTSIMGSTTAITYQFSKAEMPPDIVSGSNLAVVLGGRVAPLQVQGSLLVASLPPQTPPPVPDPSGNLHLVVQSDNGSAIITAQLVAGLPQIFGPNATLSAAPGGSH